ncbi:hypothetical protein Tco_0008461 [Tanacetum coccineum]
MEALLVWHEECHLHGSQEPSACFDQKELNMRQRRWIEMFSDYECEIRYHPGNVNVVVDALSMKEQVKPRLVRAMAMTIQSGVKEMILAAQNNSKEWNSGDDQLRLRWMIYLVVLADAVESVRDAIGFEYCLASSSGWTKLASAAICKNGGVTLADANLHVPLDEIKVDKTLRFVEEPVEIMDREIRNLKRRKTELLSLLVKSLDEISSRRGYCNIRDLIRWITYGYPWPELEGKRIWIELHVSLVYSFQLDEQWFTLNDDLLRKALEITPADSTHPFVSHPAGDQVMDFVNELGYPKEIHFVSKMHVNNLYQPWRAILSLINQCLTGKTFGSDKPRHPVLQMLWGIVTRSNVYYAELLWEEFVQAI